MLFFLTKQRSNSQRGFSLIEMIVATSIFVTLMLIIVGALISLDNAARKARTMRIAMDNLSAALDSMSRNIRMGTILHCETTNTFTTPVQEPRNCPMTSELGGGGGTMLAFDGQNGDRDDATDQIVYRLSNGRIQRSLQSGAANTFLDLTAPEITIQTLRFYVHNTEVEDNQPSVTILLRGVASTSSRTASSFNVQTTISQRTPNLDFTP